MSYIVYILKSDSKNKFYIGCTSNLEKRIFYHNNGKNKSTKPYKPWKVIYTEKFKNKSDAYRREWFLKHPNGYKNKKSILLKYGGVA